MAISILSGFPFGTSPPSVTSAIRAEARFPDGRRGLYPVVGRPDHFRLKSLAPQFVKEHVRHALRPCPFRHFVYQQAPRKIPLVSRFPIFSLLTSFHARVVIRLTTSAIERAVSPVSMIYTSFL